jgi:U32 family peptidase
VSGVASAPLVARLTALGRIGGGVSVEGATEALLSPATGRGLDEEVLGAKLGAMGGTPFRIEGIDLHGLGAGLHVPVSALKALKRSMTSRLLDAVLASRRHRVSAEPAAPRIVAEAAALGRQLGTERGATGERDADPGDRNGSRPAPSSSRWRAPERPSLIPLVRNDEQLEAVIAAGLSAVELDWMEYVGLERAVRRARQAGLELVLATTRVQKPLEERLEGRLAELEPDGILARHFGALIGFAGSGQGVAIHGDFSLNVTNSVTGRHLLALGADTLTAAHDLDEAQLHALLGGLPPERLTVVVHHHIPAFHTEHCLYARSLSTGRDHSSCGRPCERHRLALEDSKGLRHPVLVDVACRNTVFNARAQSAARAVPGLLARGVKRFRVELVWENRAESDLVLAGWRSLLAGALGPDELNRRLSAVEQLGVTAGTMRTLGPASYGVSVLDPGAR